MYLSLIMPAFQPFFTLREEQAFMLILLLWFFLLLLMGMAHLGFRSKNIHVQKDA